MKKLELTLGYTKSGVPVLWSEADNPHVAVSGRSGMGKSFFLKGLLEQAARGGATCIVLDFSNDFRCYTPPGDLPFRSIGVTDSEFTLNPLAGAETQGGSVCAQRLLSSLHGIFRMGPRANLALQKAALTYLENESRPTLRGLADFVHSQPLTDGLAAALEPLELLGSLIRCGEEPIGLELTQPGLTVLGFEQVLDVKVRALLVELILSAIWDQRTARTEWEHPLIVLLDECQNLSWGENSMAIRILREGRKYGIGGWLSSQWVTNKNAVPALGQAALQVFFRPDDTNLTQLAKNLSQGKSGQVEQCRKVIRSLRVGQFLFRRPDGRILVVSVPPRPEEGGKVRH